MRPAGFLIVVVAAAPAAAQSAVVSSSIDARTVDGRASLLDAFAIEIGLAAVPMRSADGTSVLDLPPQPGGSAAAPTAAAYLFVEAGYRFAGDIGNWRVRMGDVPLELRSATWESAPPLMRVRGAVFRFGFGAVSAAK